MVLQAAGGSGGGGETAGANQFRSNIGGGGSGGALVYMGQTNQSVGRGGKYMSEAAQAQVQRRKVDVWVTEGEASGDFYNWSTKKQRDFIAAGIIGGQLKLGDGLMEAGKFWEKLVKEAAKYGKAGRKVTPWDLMASYVNAAGGGGKASWVKQGDFEVNTVTGERRYTGPRFKTQTDTRVDLTDPDTARAIATKLFQDMMGRDPQGGELKAFATALHTAEESSPVTQTTTTEYNMTTGEPLGSKTSSTGGMSAEARAYVGEQQIKKKKEYGVTQAVTTYQNALENLIYGAPE